jgi:integrase
MAEKRLRELISDHTITPVVERMTIGECGRKHITHLRTTGRKRSTLQNYESELRVHFVPYFEDKAITRITKDQVEDFIEHCLEDLSVKTTRNLLNHLHSIFEFAARKEWATTNPCKLVDKPQAPDEDAEIHFLDQDELDAVLAAAGDQGRHKPETMERAARVRDLRDNDRHEWKTIATIMRISPATAIYLYRCEDEEASDGALADIERVLYLIAAMTGLRQGELLALRWMDVDWIALKIRVRQNFVRGEYGTPKSKRSSRAVPMADLVAQELELLFQRSARQADSDLVFGHPLTGNPLDRSKVTKRFKRILKRAGVREVRFHDLRHTFGTRMAAANVPMRTLQEWMGHRDIKTTQIYADYAPAANEVELVNSAFQLGTNFGTSLRATQSNSEPSNPVNTGDPD